MSVIDEIFETFEKRGGGMYSGEPVTQLEHALQCAELARKASASDALVTAALLHDYGHLLNKDDAMAAGAGEDLVHEEIAATHLSRWFGKDVTEPIRMHVPAKQYLCAIDPDYLAGLSSASAISLQVQGGVFTKQQAGRFIACPHAKQAVLLRHWDDLAKIEDAVTAPLESFRKEVTAVFR